MSQHNVEVFKRGADAYNRRDAGAFLEDAHPDVEWRPVFQTLLGGGATIFRGHDAIRRMFREVDESLAAIVVDFSEGKVLRVQTFLDPAQALDAAGLSE
jgi:ketosteroid isomerase-like protein